MIGKHELLCRHYFSGVCTCRADHADDCVSFCVILHAIAMAQNGRTLISR